MNNNIEFKQEGNRYYVRATKGELYRYIKKHGEYMPVKELYLTQEELLDLLCNSRYTANLSVLYTH